MKRAVVFAHYDKDNLVDDYVIYYLKSLKEISDEIIFVSDCTFLENKNLLDGLVSHIIVEKHNEYDFGSYKRGYSYLKEKLADFDEIIFANDSCYGPFYSLNKIFDEMEQKDCDFWGITKNNFGYRKNLSDIMGWRPHVQSYFIVFKKNVFLSKVFDDFIKSIKEEKTKRGVISNYEIGLSEHLKQAGYKYSTLINAYPYINNVAIWKWYQIILKHKMPFLKCSMPRLKNKNFVTAAGYEDVINSVSDYPIELIYNNIRRFGIEPKKYSKRFIILKRIVFKFVPYIPDFLRHIIRVTVGQFLKFIKD